MAGLSAEPVSSCGLYIHVPFCLRKCFYCDFYSIPYSPARAVCFLAALTREISIRAQNPPFAGRRFSSLYFGGGSPSLLTTEQLAKMLSAVNSAFGFAWGRDLAGGQPRYAVPCPTPQASGSGHLAPQPRRRITPGSGAPHPGRAAHRTPGQADVSGVAKGRLRQPEHRPHLRRAGADDR